MKQRQEGMSKKNFSLGVFYTVGTYRAKRAITEAWLKNKTIEVLV